MKTLYVKTRTAWRKWLEKHHAKQKEVWLLYYKKHTGKQRVEYADALAEALCFGWIDGKVKSIDEDRYMQRFTPRTAKSQWSTTNVKLYRALEKEGLVTPAGHTAFAAKSRVYTPVQGKKSYQWHVTHKLPKNPTVRQKVAWHRGHQEHCGCRPIPKSLLQYFSK